MEALLAARDRLVITFQGRGIRDNKALPPAVPVEELLGGIQDSCIAAGASAGDNAEDVRAQVLTEHPLQAFSPRCFSGEGTDPRRSFDQRYLRAARRLRQDPVAPPPFLNGQLPPPEQPTTPRAMSLDELTRFWSGPCIHFLNRRLGIWLREEEGGVTDRESATLGPLERYGVGDRLLGWELDPSPSLPDPYQLVRAAGDLPLGSPGRVLFDDIARDATRLARAAKDQLQPPRQPPIDVDLELGTTRLRGFVEGPWATGLVVHQYAKIKAKNILSLWVRHLAALLSAPGFVGTSLLVGRSDSKYSNAPGLASLARVARQQAEAALSTLVDLYWRGQEQPLLFFPETSRAHAEAQRWAPDDPADWIRAARTYWSAWGPVPMEGDDPHVRRLFGEAAPFEPDFALQGLPLEAELDFAALARTVWDPVLAALSEEVLK